mgnify:FL=1|tara:strand:+ start:1523 stop:1891 length:369 start_codon:yes stop_codon:yes gene_type:complete
MFNHISRSRIISILCLLLTLVISLWIGKNDVLDDVLEDFTVENLEMFNSFVSSPAPAPAPAKKTKKEGFQQKIKPTPIDQNITIETFPKTQPPYPEKYSSTGVFGHLFGLSNPNEQFTIPKI